MVNNVNVLQLLGHCLAEVTARSVDMALEQVCKISFLIQESYAVGRQSILIPRCAAVVRYIALNVGTSAVAWNTITRWHTSVVMKRERMSCRKEKDAQMSFLIKYYVK